MAVPDRVVFDAEPLIAHADDEPGSDVVEEYLDAVAVKDTAGYVSCVNFAEIRYTLARKYDRTTPTTTSTGSTNSGSRRRMSTQSGLTPRSTS